MPISFTTTDKKAMSRAIVNHPFILQGLTISVDNIEKDRLQIIENDNLNKEFMDFYHDDISKQYESERENLNGSISATFTETDIDDAAQFKVDALFFPIGDPPTSPYKFLIPKIVPEVNGGVSGTNTSSEQHSIDNLELYIQFIKTGFSFGGSANINVVYNPGDGVIQINSGAFNDGEYIYTAGAIFLIDSGGGTTVLTVTEIVAPTLALSVGTTLNGNFSGFSNSQRENLTAGDQDVLDSLSSLILTNATNWQTALNNQLTAIAANEEERATQQSQLTTAQTNANSTLSQVNSWLALSNTGSGGKYSDTGLNILSTEITSREPIITTRLSEISTALGSITDNGDGTFTGTDGEIYFERYKWVNARINKVFGSAIGKFEKEKAKDFVQIQVDNLNFELDEYKEEMVATKISEDITTTARTIIVDDLTNFNVSDTIFILSELKSEVSAKIIFIDTDSRAITLDTEIQGLLLIDDLARIYKLI